MTDNELIAEFMGADKEVPKEYLNGDYNNCYHSSWDWLMPVVKKINDLFDEDGMRGLDYDMIKSMQDWILSVMIKEAYCDVVSIIKSYKANGNPTVTITDRNGDSVETTKGI